MAKHWIVTGHFTADGAVSWRRTDGTWSRRFAEAGLFVDEPPAKAAVAAATATEQYEVSDPYVIEVQVDGPVVDPVSARERIRATGPTIRIRRPD